MHSGLDETMVPFEFSVSQEVIADLRERIARTRWPDEIGDSEWTYGTSLSYMKRLCGHWADDFDWDAFTSRLNQLDQYSTQIDGQRLHFLHVRPSNPRARPLLLMNGWPSSIVEYLDVTAPLSEPDPAGQAEPYELIVPSLPGYGFSGPTSEGGWDTLRIADAIAELMSRLGHERFFIHGSDWGSAIGRCIAERYPHRVAALQLTILGVPPGAELDDPTTEERSELERRAAFIATETAYQSIQRTKPQALAYGMSDSPAGLAAWLVDKFRGWSDCGGDLDSIYTLDRLLENISIYWLTGTINSSMRLYFETLGRSRWAPGKIEVPLGYACFPGEPFAAPRRLVEACHPDLDHWFDAPRGGHFAAMEQPEAFIDAVRAFFDSR